MGHSLYLLCLLVVILGHVTQGRQHERFLREDLDRSSPIKEKINYSYEVPSRYARYHPNPSLQLERELSSNGSSLFTKIILTKDAAFLIEPHYFAVYQSQTYPDVALYGGIATLDFYGMPNLKKGEESAALIWVVNYHNNDYAHLNAIEAGWHVDGYNSTGCYNLLCEGFTPSISPLILPSDVIEPVSVVNGQKYNITIKIFQDSRDGDWWLYYGHDENIKPAGKWPKSLLTSLADHANDIHLGGFTLSTVGVPSPPMKNSQWISGDAASFRGVRSALDDGSESHFNASPLFLSDMRCYQIGQFLNDSFNYGRPDSCT